MHELCYVESFTFILSLELEDQVSLDNWQVEVEVMNANSSKEGVNM